VEAVGLNELMKHAGFTPGGFYNHFGSKAALVAEVLTSAMAEGAVELAKSARAPVDESTTALRRHIGCYLSQTHRDNIDHGCPVAGFAGDAPRLGAEAQSHLAGGLDDPITILARLIAESGSLAAAGERRTALAFAFVGHARGFDFARPHFVAIHFRRPYLGGIRVSTKNHGRHLHFFDGPPDGGAPPPPPPGDGGLPPGGTPSNRHI
jgi:AcrR family transcriptional regulator